MYRRTIIAALCMFALLTLPQTGMAAMSALTDAEMTDVTAQAGIQTVEVANGVTRMTFDNHYDNISVFHGLLNMGDVTVQGSFESRTDDNSTTVSQFESSTLSGMTGFGIMGFGMTGLGTMSVGTHQIDATLNLDRLHIGAIRVGTDLTGPSMGSLDIIGLHATIKGTISISMR